MNWDQIKGNWTQLTGKIKELLTQKKISQLLTAWLQNLRAGSQIRAEALAPVGEGGLPDHDRAVGAREARGFDPRLGGARPLDRRTRFEGSPAGGFRPGAGQVVDRLVDQRDEVGNQRPIVPRAVGAGAPDDDAAAVAPDGPLVDQRVAAPGGGEDDRPVAGLRRHRPPRAGKL